MEQSSLMKKPLLIDTHVFLWAAHNDPRLGLEAVKQLQHTRIVFLSAISILEVKIKISTGKLLLADLPEDLIQKQSLEVLDFNYKHALNYKLLNPQNADPFDNTLLAVAESNNMVLLTADKKILPLANRYDWIIDARK